MKTLDNAKYFMTDTQMNEEIAISLGYTKVIHCLEKNGKFAMYGIKPNGRKQTKIPVYTRSHSACKVFYSVAGKAYAGYLRISDQSPSAKCLAYLMSIGK